MEDRTFRVGAVAAAPAELDQIALHQRLLEAISRGDVMEAMGLFADDAAFGGRGCGRHPAAVCLGKEEIGHYTFEAPDRPGYPDVFRRPATDRAARDQYLAEGRPLHTGANPAAASYGRTLERMAKESPEEFYQGGV